MIIKDAKGMYTIEVDTKRRVVKETPLGLWTKEDFERFHNDYVTKVLPAIGTKPWVKLSDVREYKTSNVADVMEKHVKWSTENGMAPGAIVVSSAIVKMQINRAGRSSEPTAFTSVEEADKWLKEQGF